MEHLYFEKYRFEILNQLWYSCASYIVATPDFLYKKSSLIKTHSSVSAPKKTKEDALHTSVLFTGSKKLPNSTLCISKTTKPISTKFIYIFALQIH